MDPGCEPMEYDVYKVALKTRYAPEAFEFVQQGLAYTVEKIHGPAPDPEDADDTNRHITGRQLCAGLREYAIDQYGLLARTVLRHWHVHRSKDFGHIVFAMVDGRLMKKTADDTLEDFCDVYDFAEAFTPALDLAETN